jgi:hypothetical protein
MMMTPQQRRGRYVLLWTCNRMNPPGHELTDAGRRKLETLEEQFRDNPPALDEIMLCLKELEKRAAQQQSQAA